MFYIDNSKGQNLIFVVYAHIYLFIEASSSSNDPAPPDTDATNATKEVIADLSQVQEEEEKPDVPMHPGEVIDVPKHTGEVVDVPEEPMSEDDSIMSEGEFALYETMEGGNLWIEGEGGSWYAGLDVWYNPDLLAHWTELENMRAEVAQKEAYLLASTDLDFRPAWIRKWVPKRKRDVGTAKPKVMPRRRRELAEDERQSDSSSSGSAASHHDVLAMMGLCDNLK